MIIARLRILFCFLLVAPQILVAPAAFASDPHPPPLNVSFLAQPSPIVQNGQARLFYEMLITNFSKNAYVLDAIEAKAGDTQTKVSGQALAPMIAHLGVSAPSDEHLARTIGGGRSVIVFLMLDLGKSAAPGAIAHTLHVLTDQKEPHDIVLAPLTVAQDKEFAVVLQPEGNAFKELVRAKFRAVRPSSVLKVSVTAWVPLLATTATCPCGEAVPTTLSWEVAA